MPRKDILSKFGITDQPDLRVQVNTEQDNPSMVDVHGPEDPPKTLTQMYGPAVRRKRISSSWW